MRRTRSAGPVGAVLGVGVGQGEFSGDAYQAETTAGTRLHAFYERERNKAIAAEGHGAGTGLGYSGEGGPASVHSSLRIQWGYGYVSQINKGRGFGDF